jgi:hypothetical protein
MRKFVGHVLVSALTFHSFALYAATIRLPEGTDVRVIMSDKISSATSKEGDRFSFYVDEAVKVNGITIIPANAKGVGEVTGSKKRGMMGRGGDLSVRLIYVLVGETRIRLRGQKGNEGDNKTGSTIALTVLFGPLGLLKRGKDATINSGQALSAYVDETVEFAIPDNLQPAPLPTLGQVGGQAPAVVTAVVAPVTATANPAITSTLAPVSPQPQSALPMLPATQTLPVEAKGMTDVMTTETPKTDGGAATILAAPAKDAPKLN